MRRAVLVGVVAVVVASGCGESTTDSGTTTARGGSGGDSHTFAGAGGQGAEGGAADGGDECDENWYLWFTLGLAVGQAVCGPTAEVCGRDAQPWGVVVLDSEGRVTDLTISLEPSPKEAWLQEIAGERWPCLADQTVEYCCVIVGE